MHEQITEWCSLVLFCQQDKLTYTVTWYVLNNQCYNNNNNIMLKYLLLSDKTCLWHTMYMLLAIMTNHLTSKHWLHFHPLTWAERNRPCDMNACEVPIETGLTISCEHNNSHYPFKGLNSHSNKRPAIPNCLYSIHLRQKGFSNGI